MTDQLVQQRWESSRRLLVQEMRECLAQGKPRKVNLSVPKHTVIALSLWELATDPTLRGKSLPVIFSDGSSSAPFPVGTLSKAPSEVSCPPLSIRAGLMSFRHPELDYLVDLYVCRNLEIAKSESMASEEALAYDRTVDLFGGSDAEAGGLIEVFHTGLEPLVVGFYRGVVEVLRRRHAKVSPTIVFRPLVFPKKGESEALTAQSPGAKRENYVALPDWR